MMTREFDSIADDVAGRSACDASTTTAVADSDAWFAALGAESSPGGLSREGPRKTSGREPKPTAPEGTRSRQRRPAQSASSRESSESAAHGPKAKLLGSNRLARFWLIGCLLLGSFFGIRALAPSSTSTHATQAPPTSTASLAPRLKNIEDVRVGDRVRADNPTDEVDLAFGDDVVPEQWRHLELRLQKPDGSVSEISLLRPAAWVVALEATAGSAIPVDIPHTDIRGQAEVLSIGPCPPIAQGNGRVVTGAFKHIVGGTVELHLVGRSAAVGVTANHPVWSVDRQAFVPAGNLRPGERLRGTGGTLQVASVVSQAPERTTVYNLEVQVDHVYHVAADGVLVHNSQKQCTISIPSQKYIDNWEQAFGGKAGVQANKVAGDAVRDAIAAREAPALIEQNFRVTPGLRRYDVVKQGNRVVAFESKVGRTSLTRRVRQELSRDVKALRSQQVDEVVWEFTRSRVTGKKGPTQRLLDKLNKFGITVIIN